MHLAPLHHDHGKRPVIEFPSNFRLALCQLPNRSKFEGKFRKLYAISVLRDCFIIRFLATQTSTVSLSNHAFSAEKRIL